MPSLPSQRKESALGPHQLHVLNVLRAFVEISQAEQKIARVYVGCNCNEPEQPKPQGNTGHDEEGHLALMGYCK